MNSQQQAHCDDWRTERARILAQARTIVIKIGSAVLTDARGLNNTVMTSLARQMAAVRDAGGVKGTAFHRRLILVSSGAVSAGRAYLAERGRQVETEGLAARQAAAAVGQGLLMQAWDKAFFDYDLPTAQVLLTRDDLRSRQRFLNARNTFAELLQWHVLPIINENDTVSVNELKFGDNDCLAGLLVNLTGADLFINLTSAPGVLSADPQRNPTARVMDHIDDVAALDLGQLCGGKTSVGTGGMYSKLLAARRAAQIGVPTWILPGREPDILMRALAAAQEQPSTALSASRGATQGAGMPTGMLADITADMSHVTAPGTWVCPAAHAVSRRKFRLAYESEPAGAVHLDAGAADALLHRGSSLLPGGVVQVEGAFHKGAPVRVLHEGKSLGVGLSNYSAPDLKKIMGRKRHEVAVILGDAHYPEVIHRDNLLLDAAI